ncbi:CHAT domain-containing protein [Planktothricoides raciborskii]|uniref:CHAT domain-containing protein n=1 Tax=Planktothricoides raciborskii FACHB-1370 TaxID=2949576 RepID=A0ABR8EFL7_9CYAN|nr:CHAT domain-containing protein [Planktothricoides raciborskii]MBD2545644.1 CHAT domain-containing protein [Planktothricoides raciborskii FACHB-1370]MBD2585260.1 CHAT domain-containing protein [Planktothricoides raciborskii FACHB-1261]
MNYQNQAKIKLISGVIIASTTLAIPVNAQPITPAADGTGTIVNQQDNIINITGGQTSSNGANLFHSFDQFGVNTGQTANFQSAPEINNILGRVVGGNASIINGILQVTGGNSNLFLMNPAGILFGPNASLNVPADFTATTATSIGFGNNNWFQSIGDNNWANLVGNPSDFSFNLAQPGWVVNFADLTLNSGQNLTLLGGGILNSGNLSAPGGNISIAAVPGENTIRISQPGNILSLDIATPGLNQGVINPLSLPELLTGGNAIIDATQVQQNADGTITLTSSAVTIDPNYDTGLVLAAGDVTTETSGQVNVLTNGGNIILDQVNSDKVNINANGGNITQLNSDSLINASAVQLQTVGEGGIGLETQPLRLEADNLEATAGSGGAFFYVPNGDITVESASNNLFGISTSGGGAVSLTAAGNITVNQDISTSVSFGNAGNITLTSEEGAIDTAHLLSYTSKGNGGSVTLNAGGNIFAYYDIDSHSEDGDGGAVTMTAGGDITADNIDSHTEDGDASDVTMTAGGDITTGDIVLHAQNGDGGDVTMTAEGNIITGDIWSYGFTGGAGDVTMTAEGGIVTGDIDSSSESADAGDVTVTAAEDIRINSINSEGYTQGGDIALTSQGGAIDTTNGSITDQSTSGIIDSDGIPGILSSISDGGSAGHITLNASSDIRTGFVFSSAGSAASSQGGNITMTSHNGAINISAGILSSMSVGGNAGHITLDASSDIRTGFVVSSAGSAASSQGGDITMTSHNGAINTTVGDLSGEAQINPTADVSSPETASIFADNSANLSAYSRGGIGGNVSLSAAGDITTSHISAFGPQGTGNVGLTSSNGAINIGAIFSFSQNGNAGNVTLNAANDINTSHISAWGNQQGGNIIIDAGNIAGQLNNDTPCDCVNLLGTESTPSFNIGSATIHSFSQAGHGGNVTITTSGDTNLGGDETRHAIRSAGYTEGGDISIFSLGNINSLGDIETFSDIGIGGDVSLKANGSVVLPNIRTFGQIESGDLIILSCENLVKTGLVETVAPNGTSGNIQINTFGISGNIQTAELVSAGEDGSGNITVVAENGSVKTENITSLATEGDSGDITVAGQDDVITGDITSEGDDNSGDISVNSDEGSVTTGDVTTTAENGNSGDVTVAAQNNVQTGDITSQAGQNSGDIAVNSQEGSTTTGNIATIAQNGNSGDVNVTAQNDVKTGNVTSQANQNSGNILVNSEQGSATTGNVATVAENGNSGDVTVTAQNDVKTGDITSQAGQNSGNILVNSEQGSVTTGNIASIAENGSSGNIAVRANNDIYTLNISSIAAIDSGDISVTSNTGNINTGNLATVAKTGNSGDISLTANQDINTGDISSIGGTNSGDISATSTEGAISTGDIETRAMTGIAGDVTLNAQDDINTGSITSTGAISSGDITVNSTEGVVNTGEIYTDTGEINIHQGGLNSEDKNSGLTNSIAQDSIAQDTLSFSPVFNPENSQSMNSSNSRINVPQNLDNFQVFNRNILENSIDDRISTIEESRTSEFADSLGISAENQVITTASAREILGSMAQQTGTQSAVVYVTAYEDQLELILFTADGAAIRAAVPEANRQALTKQVQEFRNEITDPRQRRSNSYLASAQQLYQWLIAPIESELQAAEIDTILFSMDSGLRGLPIAALYDGQQFLVEKYSLSLIPSVSLMDAHYQSLQGKKVLAMGADTFPDLEPLPGVSLELNVITQNLWPGTQLYNQEFTRGNLQEEREHHGYDIVHLATHADFTPGQNNQTFIYFWNDKLPLDDLRDLGLNHPATELLVLSACRTAVGDEMAELGFAGLAVRTGVKSALASLWYVSDEGTLGLMTEFYQFLHSAPIKAEALRQAQVAMIHNQMQFSSSQLPGSKQLNETNLPPELVRVQNMNLSHPYFWSGFTMIGSPW